MSKTNTYENDELKLYFNGTTASGVAAASGGTNRYVSLHKADPGETGSRSNECAYTGYAEIAIIRDATGWTVTGNSVSPAADNDFNVKTAGTDEVATHFGVARSSGGTIDWVGQFATPINIANGIVPRFKTGTTITVD